MTIKISELGNLAVFTDATLFPVVNTAGIYTTVKSNGAVISDYISAKIIPIQTGNNGKYLTTNGNVTSWSTVTALPDQTGNVGKYLTTDGTIATWANVSALPDQAGNTGKFLTTDGNVASWSNVVGGGGGATITNDTTTVTTLYPVFTSTTTGSMTEANVSITKLQFTPNTGSLFATEFLSSSDLRLKENITPLLNSTDIVRQLSGVSFNWKETGAKSYGVIAQDIEKILPELVQATDDGFKRVKYDALVAFLIEAIKELSNRIDILENK